MLTRHNTKIFPCQELEKMVFSENTVPQHPPDAGYKTVFGTLCAERVIESPCYTRLLVCVAIKIRGKKRRESEKSRVNTSGSFTRLRDFVPKNNTVTPQGICDKFYVILNNT